MAKAQVGGLRTAAGQASPQGVESSPSPPKKFKWEFQSSKPALLLSFEERITHWTPSGGSREEFPKTADGSRLDMVRFENSYFGTNDDGLAERLMGHEGFRLGGLLWLADEMLKAQRDAEVTSMRQRLASDPELARQVLKPSEEEDFKLPPAIG
jgi:hypothetical protein